MILGEAAGEVVALEELGDGKLAGQSYHVGQAERPKPVALPSDFGAVAVHYLEELREVGLGVLNDLLVGEHGPRGGSSRRIADLRRPVSHDDNNRMPEFLQLPQLAKAHRMAQVDIRRGRVEPHLQTQRVALF